MDVAISVDHTIRLKEKEKKDKYPDLARELKRLWNMKVRLIPILTGALITIPKRFIKGLEKGDK